jgi:hypothetical protein
MGGKIRHQFALPQVHLHAFVSGIVQREIQELEIDRLLNPLGQIAKEFGETPMADHEVRHFQQSLIASKFPRGIGLQLPARLHGSTGQRPLRKPRLPSFYFHQAPFASASYS